MDGEESRGWYDNLSVKREIHASAVRGFQTDLSSLPASMIIAFQFLLCSTFEYPRIRIRNWPVFFSNDGSGRRKETLADERTNWTTEMSMIWESVKCSIEGTSLSYSCQLEKSTTCVDRIQSAVLNKLLEVVVVVRSCLMTREVTRS